MLWKQAKHSLFTNRGRPQKEKNMKIIKWLIVLAIIMFTSCTAEVTPDFITTYHKAKLAQLSADTNHYDVVFMGDSITEGGAFESILQNTKNAGISGDWITRTEEVIPCVRQYTPDKIYLMIGVKACEPRITIRVIDAIERTTHLQDVVEPGAEVHVTVLETVLHRVAR